MNWDKDQIFQLRQEGKSFREIQKLTGVSRSTLSKLFKDVAWSRHISVEKNRTRVAQSREKMLKLNMVRKIKLDYLYAKAEDDAKREFEINKKNPNFVLGTALYLSHGDKKNTHEIRFSSTDLHLHKIFHQFLKKYLIKQGEIVKMQFVTTNFEQKSPITQWSKYLGLPASQFYVYSTKSPLIKAKRLQKEVGISILSSTLLKKKLMKWLFLLVNEKL